MTAKTTAPTTDAQGQTAEAPAHALTAGGDTALTADALIAALPTPTAVFAADGPAFTVLAANDALLATAQRPREAIVGRSLAEAFPNASPDDPAASGLAVLRASLETAVRTGIAQRIPRQRYDLQRPDGVWEVRYWDAVNIPVPGPNGAMPYVLHQTEDVTAQVLSEQATARAEQRAEGILERMADAHCVLDREFRIVTVNAATERVLGMPRAVLLGRSHWDVFPASADAPVGHAYRRVVAEGVEQHLAHHYTGEGYDFHLEVDAYPTEEGGVAVFWRDITARVHAEAALRASEAKYRTIIESIDEGFSTLEVLYDDVGRPADLLYREINPAFERHTGVSACVGRTVREILPTIEDAWIEMYARVARTGESLRFERYNESTRRWFSSYLSRVGDDGSSLVASVFNDITERKLTEAALTAAAARDAFLIQLADALRPLAGAVEVQAEAARVLGDHLGASRVMYGEADQESEETFTIHREYRRDPAMPASEGQHRWDDFGPYVETELRAGRTLVVDDVRVHRGHSPSELAAYEAVGIGAYVAVPLVQDGRIAAYLAVNQTTARAWAAEEIELVRETAERTWAAVERARAEASLDRERTLLRTVLDQMPTAVLIVEAPSGRVLALNDAVSRVWGEQRPYTDAVAHYSEEWVGYHLDGRRVGSEEWPLARAVLAGETVTDWAGEIERPDGTRATIEVCAAPVRDAAGHTVAAVGVVADITARVQAARERERLVRALDVERARLANVFERAPTFLAVLRGPTFVYELVNEAYMEVVGRRDFVGKALLDAFPEARDQGFVGLLDDVLATGEPFVGREMPFSIIRTPGAAPEPRFVDFVYLPLVEADGTRSGVICNGSDVTEQVQARREIERLLAESERARQDAEAARGEAEAANRSKGEFLAVMSHELRTPLNAIGGYVELMELGIRGPVTPQQREDFARIQKSQRHLLGLINGVLNYTRAEAGAVHYEMADVPLDAVLATCETLIAPQARAKQIALHLAGSGEPLVVRADREKLQQIVVNLLSNAVKFTAPGGSVTLACERDTRVRDGGNVVVTVRDTGRGIAADALERVFEPFVQVDARLTRSEEGIGLGLAISRDLARGMGGDLTAESTAGVGSTFTLTLPHG